MPEGPEVRISAELIRPLVVGKYIINAFPTKSGRYKINPPEGFDSFIKAFNVQDLMKVIDVAVKGKFMYWTFSNNNETWYMFNTFGMSGQWSPKEGKHPCFGFYVSNEMANNYKEIFFNDPRHFGTIKFTSLKKELNDKLSELGWDPFGSTDPDVSEKIHKILNKTSKPIGQMLMDQKVFAGVGNYIRAEALYLARMSPWAPSNCLPLSRIKELCDVIVQVMKESYDHQGATIHTYKDAYGQEGKYSSCFKVYGQKKDPLGNPIIKEDTPDGRTIHWCPIVQCEKF